MENYLIKDITAVNEGRSFLTDVLIRNGRIEKIQPSITVAEKVIEINGEGKHLLPGAIDDQVHFSEPGLTHKATIYSESAPPLPVVLQVSWKCLTPFHRYSHRNCLKRNMRLQRILHLQIILSSWALPTTIPMKL